MRGSCTESGGKGWLSLSIFLSPFLCDGTKEGGGSEARGEFSTRLVPKHVGRRVSEKGGISGNERGCSDCRGVRDRERDRAGRDGSLGVFRCSGVL